MPVLRYWYRASQYFMEWVKKSLEEPLAPVSRIWMTYKWQDETAGFPHLHAILCFLMMAYPEFAVRKKLSWVH